MKYLTQVREVYRVDTEAEAESFVQEMKKENIFEIKSYSIAKKEKKSKGEIVDEWYNLTVNKIFNDEKEPEKQVEVNFSLQE